MINDMNAGPRPQDISAAMQSARNKNASGGQQMRGQQSGNPMQNIAQQAGQGMFNHVFGGQGSMDAQRHKAMLQNNRAARSNQDMQQSQGYGMRPMQQEPMQKSNQPMQGQQMQQMQGMINPGMFQQHNQDFQQQHPFFGGMFGGMFGGQGRY